MSVSVKKAVSKTGLLFGGITLFEKGIELILKEEYKWGSIASALGLIAGILFVILMERQSRQ